MMRIAGFALSIVGVLFLGRALYELLWFGHLAWPSLVLGMAAACGGYLTYLRAQRSRDRRPS